MRTWFERIRSAILDLPSPVIIEAGEEWGVARLVAGLRDPEQPLIWIDLRDVDCGDAVAVGNAISDAVRRGLGSSLFGLGVDSDYALAALESFVPALEPLTVAVSGAERRPDLIMPLSTMLGPPNRLVVTANSHSAQFDEIANVCTLTKHDLRVTVDEAVDLFGADRDRESIARAVREGDGALASVEQSLSLNQSAAMDARGVPDHVSAAMRQGVVGVVNALVARRRWIDAFEYAVDHAPTRIGEVLDEAGNAYFEQGEFDRFWRYLSYTPRWALRDERSMYWVFDAAMAVNQWRTVLPQVDKYLETHEAPDLRARRATVDVSEKSIHEAMRAHHAKRTPETARALAFLREFSGDLDAAIDLYREAIELAEAEGRPRHVVSAAAGMAQVHLFAGRYERAQHWGKWAVEQYRAHELREELLRISAISVCGYSRLLTGAMNLARQVLETVHIHDSMLGIPTMEGVVSTLGDLALAEGRHEDGIAYYKMNLQHASRRMYSTLANDLVLAHLLSGQSDRALMVASEASEIANFSSGYQRTVADLSLGCVLAHSDPPQGERLLRSALSAMRAQPLGPHRAQAAIHLGRFLLRQGRPEEARRLLEEHARFVAELGDSGWLLLGGDGPEVTQLKRMFRSGEPEIQLRLLGKRQLRNRDSEESLSLRFAEVLAVLAANPNGIRAEQLALGLYGDREVGSTVKATVSKARKFLPIESRPYRIGEACQTDFVQVMELLRTGKVQAALELYRGPLLPESEAPAVVELREHLEESLRQAVLASGDPDAMIDLANQQGDDLELWEETRRHLPPNDPRRPLANARIRRIRKRWGSSLD